MKIKKAFELQAFDTRTAWNSLSRFQNVSYVSDELIRLQAIPQKQHKNARKQAEQIRFCLLQAAEYFAAANSVSIATKPLLLYYGVMSLALAELLFKQDGSSSLDAARGQNAHHGLLFALGGKASRAGKLSNSAALLSAKPIARPDIGRLGTFELWHRSSRTAPMITIAERAITNGKLKQVVVFANSDDERLDLLDDAGVSLLQCLEWLPGMRVPLAEVGVISKLVRVRTSHTINIDGVAKYKIISQPGYPAGVKKLRELIKTDPALGENVKWTEMGTGFKLEVTVPADHSQTDVSALEFPQSFQVSADELFFCPELTSLTEFGLFYVAIYMLGMYARYHPDSWMEDVEKRTQLATVAESFLSLTTERVPILALSELSQTWHLLERRVGAN